MKKDAENKEKDIVEEKSGLSGVVQVNFTDGADESKSEEEKRDVKTIDISASKQELLKEIDRLFGEIKNKDAEIERLKGMFGELFDIENKKEESIAIHKKAVDALNDAIKEAEKIVENAKKVADKIIKNAGDSLERSTGSFDTVAFEPASQLFEEQKRSIAEETMQELRLIKNSSPAENEADDYSFSKSDMGALTEGEKIKLPGADDLVISKDLLTVNSLGVNGASGINGIINMDEIDEFVEHIKNEEKNKLADEAANGKDINNEDEQDMQGNYEADITDLETDTADKKEKKKSGWFRGFSKK